MARKKWTRSPDDTPGILTTREKRKWQIALRRYVLDRAPSSSYAPYFGLDIENMRTWFENQFNGLTWEDFGKKWHFDHILPLSHFDLSQANDLRLCWNFANLRVKTVESGGQLEINLLAAKSYFHDLFKKTGYGICEQLASKADEILKESFLDSGESIQFITDRIDYLKMISAFSSFDFEMLNAGKDPESIIKESALLKKLGK